MIFSRRCKRQVPDNLKKLRTFTCEDEDKLKDTVSEVFKNLSDTSKIHQVDIVSINENAKKRKSFFKYNSSRDEETTKRIKFQISGEKKGGKNFTAYFIYQID